MVNLWEIPARTYLNNKSSWWIYINYHGKRLKYYFVTLCMWPRLTQMRPRCVLLLFLGQFGCFTTVDAYTGVLDESLPNWPTRRVYVVVFVWLKQTYRCMYICVYIYICMYVCLSVCLSVYRSIDLSIYRSIDLSIYLSIHRSIFISM